MIRNIWKEVQGVGELSFRFRLLAYGMAALLMVMHQLENSFSLKALHYISVIAFLIMPHVFLYRYVASGMSLARSITDTAYDFFFSGWFIGMVSLSVIPSFVFALGSITNYLAVRGFHKLYRILFIPIGCLPALWLNDFQIHLKSSNVMLFLSLSYCVVHYIVNAYILYSTAYTTRLQNAEIEKQRAEIHEKSEELIQLNESLKNANTSLELKVLDRTRELEIKNQKLEEYTFINAHKLRAPVATVLGLIQLFNYKDQVEGEKIMDGLKKTAIELDIAIKDIRKKLEEEGAVPQAQN